MKRVVTFGELMLRLSPPGQERLFQSPQLRTFFGGSEANVAASLAHFGVHSDYVTRVPRNAVGDAAVAAMRAEGVGTRGMLRGGGRLGIPTSLWVAVAIVSVAAAAHQWWSANLFTTASDMFPRRAVASVVGIGGFTGAMGGVLFQRATGRILEATNNNYSIIFMVCGLAYVTALLVMHLIVPRLEPARIDG